MKRQAKTYLMQIDASLISSGMLRSLNLKHFLPSGNFEFTRVLNILPKIYGKSKFPRVRVDSEKPLG